MEQLCELETYFSTQRYLDTKERAEFAKKIKLSDTQVKTWFQNRRMKLKRQRLEASNRQAKYAMFNNFGYTAPKVGTFPTIRNDGNQNLALPFPLVLPREIVYDLCCRDAADQARSSFPVMLSPYSISGQPALYHTSTVATCHHRWNIKHNDDFIYYHEYL